MARAAAAGEGDLQRIAGQHAVRLGRGPPIEQHQAVADQLRGAGPGQAEHPGQGGVEPLAVQAVWHCELRSPGTVIARRPRAGAPARIIRFRIVRFRIIRFRIFLFWGAWGVGAGWGPGRARAGGQGGRAGFMGFMGFHGLHGFMGPEGPGAVQADAAQGEQDDQDAGADDAGVGDVEHRPVAGHLDPVNHVAAERAGRAEDPVDQVAGGPAEQQPEGDGPAGAAQVARGAQDVGDHARRDQGEDDRDGGAAQVEGRAAVADLREHEHVADHVHIGLLGDVGDHQHLGDQIGRDHDDGHAEQQADPAQPPGLPPPFFLAGLLTGQWRSSRCLQVTHRWARGNAIRRALPDGSPTRFAFSICLASIRPGARTHPDRAGPEHSRARA